MAAKKISLTAIAADFLKEAWLTSWELIRITIPVVVVVKVCEEAGAIGYLSVLLEPIMGLLGLPGALGLVWATALLTHLYGGIAVFAALAPEMALTTAQITVLGSVMLIAHALPIELTVAKRAGASVMSIGAVRLGGALAYGYLLNGLCSWLGIWQDQAKSIFSATGQGEGIGSWIVAQCFNIILIIVIISCILLCMRVLRAIGCLGLLERLLAPVLPMLGMGPAAAPLTVVGMLMGLGYGGALIIREAATGKLSRDEVFNAMVLMGLCHSIVEDTLLIVAIGGKFGGVLWGRLVFSLVVTALLARIMQGRRRRQAENGRRGGAMEEKQRNDG